MWCRRLPARRPRRRRRFACGGHRRRRRKPRRRRHPEGTGIPSGEAIEAASSNRPGEREVEIMNQGTVERTALSGTVLVWSADAMVHPAAAQDLTSGINNLLALLNGPFILAAATLA